MTDPAAAWEATVTHNLPKSSNYRSESPTHRGHTTRAGALGSYSTSAHLGPCAALYPFIGRKSLVVAEGKTWSRLRKAFTPAFATQASPAP